MKGYLFIYFFQTILFVLKISIALLNPESVPAFIETPSACYLSSGKKPVKILLLRNALKGDWPTTLSALLIVSLHQKNYLDNVGRTRKYAFTLQTDECEPTLEISTDTYDTNSMLIIFQLFLGYTEDRFTATSSMVNTTKTLGQLTLPDTNGLVSVKISVSTGKKPILYPGSLPSFDRYHELFPAEVSREQKCVVLIDEYKNYLLKMDYMDHERIPYFKYINVELKENGHVIYTKEFAAYPSRCKYENSQTETVSDIILYVNPQTDNVEISWWIQDDSSSTTSVPTNTGPQSSTHTYSSNNESHDEDSEADIEGHELKVNVTNVQIKSMVDQVPTGERSICSNFVQNALFLVETKSTDNSCLDPEKITITKVTSDNRFPLESYTRESVETGTGHFSRRWVAQPTCTICPKGKKRPKK